MSQLMVTELSKLICFKREMPECHHHPLRFGGSSVTVVLLRKNTRIWGFQSQLSGWVKKAERLVCIYSEKKMMHMTKSPKSILPPSVIWQIYLWISLCAWTIYIQIYWSLSNTASAEWLLELQLEHEHRTSVQCCQPVLYWSPYCLFSFRFLAWPSPWHSSSRFTGLAKNMMPKASETLSHQPFCLIVQMNERNYFQKYQA